VDHQAPTNQTAAIRPSRGGAFTLRQMAFLIAAAVVAFVGTIGPAVLAAPVTVVITNSLSPKDLTVAVGTTVTWDNQDNDDHRLEFSGPRSYELDLDEGESRSITFDTLGTYQYFDDRDDDNSSYFGTVTVTESGGGGSTPTTTVPSSSGYTVIMRNDSFSPRSLTVPLGATVNWENRDGDDHDATANDGSFQTPLFSTGTRSIAFNTAGSFPYFCTQHGGMTGTITVTGGGGSTPTTTVPQSPTTTLPSTPSPGGDVTIFDNGYTPSSKTIATGTTLVWSNTGALPHTVTDTNGSFDSGFVMAGQTYARTFNTPGSYSYFCTLHPDMTGSVTVTSGGGSTPTTTVPPSTTTTTLPPAPAPPGDIKMFDNGYTPASKTITTGTTLVWSNTGALPHTVTASNGSFDSGFVMAGQTYRRTFNTPGSYSYFCTIHPGMAGTLTVTGAATGQPDTGEVSDGVADEITEEGIVDSDTSVEASGDTPPLSDAHISADIIDLDYDPRDLTVELGTTIVWTNIGELPHTVTDINGAFDSGLMLKDDVYERRFDELGTFDYFCTLHPNMVGSVTVVEVAGSIEISEAALAPVTLEAGSTPQGLADLSPAAGAIVGLLFVLAALLVGGFAMLGRKLLSSESDAI